MEVFLRGIQPGVCGVNPVETNIYVSWIGRLPSTKPGGVNMKFLFETNTSKTISNNGNNISWKNWKHLSWHPMSKHFVQSFLGVVSIYYKDISQEFPSNLSAQPKAPRILLGMSFIDYIQILANKYLEAKDHIFSGLP